MGADVGELKPPARFDLADFGATASSASFTAFGGALIFLEGVAEGAAAGRLLFWLALPVGSLH